MSPQKSRTRAVLANERLRFRDGIHGCRNCIYDRKIYDSVVDLLMKLAEFWYFGHVSKSLVAKSTTAMNTNPECDHALIVCCAVYYRSIIFSSTFLHPLSYVTRRIWQRVHHILSLNNAIDRAPSAEREEGGIIRRKGGEERRVIHSRCIRFGGCKTIPEREGERGEPSQLV